MNDILANVTQCDAKRNEKQQTRKKTHKRFKESFVFIIYGTQQGSPMTGTLTIFLAAMAVGLIGALALLQAYFIGQCFMAGQPQENGYVSADCL